jgi:Cu2+-exporting ATPase
MTHTYSVYGMSCNNCRAHVEETLKKVNGVTGVSVDLLKAEAVIEMESHVPLKKFQEALKNEGGNYSISLPGDIAYAKKFNAEKKRLKSAGEGSGVFYCPMHCEGEKTYDKPGDCPVCGMDLVEQPSADVEEEDKTYNTLLRKFKISILFTAPVFLISMSEMIHNNPLMAVMPWKYWNWVQLVLSIPVVFYTAWMFFERAWRSVKTWNLNMFTLIGIGSGVAWVFSVTALLLPGIFPDQFKSHDGTVYVYFEATTVILTLVLLGQMLEARAHGKTNSAIKELLKLSPNKATKIIDGKEQEVAIDSIRKGDLLRVKPGEKIPVDGSIKEGESTIDESMISGEPIPVDKTAGDKVSSGTINGNRNLAFPYHRNGKFCKPFKSSYSKSGR